MKTEDAVTLAQADSYEVLEPLLNALYKEFQELSKKKASEPVSKSKVRLVNRVLQPVLALLNSEPQRSFLDPLNEDDLPENSDVVLMLGQTLAAMKSFHSKYHHWQTGWRTDKKSSAR